VEELSILMEESIINSLAGTACDMHSHCVPTVLAMPVMSTVAASTLPQTVVAVAANRPVDCTARHFACSMCEGKTASLSATSS
jgi:hypothetical protein